MLHIEVVKVLGTPGSSWRLEFASITLATELFPGLGPARRRPVPNCLLPVSLRLAFPRGHQGAVCVELGRRSCSLPPNQPKHPRAALEQSPGTRLQKQPSLYSRQVLPETSDGARNKTHISCEESEGQSSLRRPLGKSKSLPQSCYVQLSLLGPAKAGKASDLPPSLVLCKVSASLPSPFLPKRRRWGSGGCPYHPWEI